MNEQARLDQENIELSEALISNQHSIHGQALADNENIRLSDEPDFNMEQPPLLRRTSTTINRRRMEELQQREVC